MVQENMKSNEFITEGPEKIILLDKQIISTLHKQCGDFLGNAKTPLYRGFKREINGLEKIPIRTNRAPADSTGVDTAAFNYMFEINTGVKYIRNITAFATSRYYIAESYGIPRMIFPINGTKFYRAKGIDDVYSEFEANIDDFDDVMYKYAMKMTKNDDDEDDLMNKLQDMEAQLYVGSGRVSKAEIHKIFGKHIGVWNLFMKQFKPIINKFYMYDGFHPELSKAREEIGMFGKPFYYVIDLSKIIDLNSDYQLYIGKNRVDIYGDGLEEVIFRAIKKNEEIYALKRNWD